MKRAVFCLSFFLSSLQAGWAAGGWESVGKILGQAGVEQEGGVLFTFPRTDLNVMVHGIALEPQMGLTSWAAFKPLAAGEGSRKQSFLLIGELVLLDEEVPPVTASLNASGIKITALESPFLDVSPGIKYLHLEGRGPRDRLATGIQAALKLVAEAPNETLQTTPSPAPTPRVPATPTQAAPVQDKVRAKVEKILGEGRLDGKVLEYSFPLSQAVTLEGEAVPAFMGASTRFFFQKVSGMTIGQPWPFGWGMGARVSKEVVAATGVFALTADQVKSTVGLLTQGGMVVTALQDPFLDETPRLFFLRFWVLGSPEEVAKGLKAVLDGLADKK